MINTATSPLYNYAENQDLDTSRQGLEDNYTDNLLIMINYQSTKMSLPFLYIFFLTFRRSP
jgi:hypothetical protein